MKIKESVLRQLIREELQDAPTLAMTKVSAGSSPEQSGVRPISGPIDLTNIVDEVMELGQDAADILRSSMGYETHDPAWNSMQAHNSISNAIMKAIRAEIARIGRELELE